MGGGIHGRRAHRSCPPKPGFGPLKLDTMQVYVEPKAMWKQIYNETWRIERDFFYDPHYHGLDLGQVKKKYAPIWRALLRAATHSISFRCTGEMTVGPCSSAAARN